ncbi:MAG: tetratricopeptide repeat protein [Nocardioidaceae bacterium]
MDPHELERYLSETWEFEDPEASYDAFRTASDAAEDGSAAGLVLRTQMARAQGLRSDFSDAQTILDAVARELDAAGDSIGEQQHHHVRARLEIERGRLLNSSGSAAASRPHFDTAYDEAMAADLAGLAVDALHMTAIVIGSTDGPASAEAVNARAISVAENSDDPEARRWLGSLLNNQGWNRHDAGAFEEALAIFRRAVEVRQQQGSKRETAIAHWCVGRCLRSLERYSEALEIQEMLASSPAGSADGYVYEELGENLMALGRETEASTYFSRAHELLSQDDWLVDNESERLERLLTLSDD